MGVPSARRAAGVPAPAFDPLANRYPCDHESRQRVEPPQPEQRVPEQADEDSGGEIGAEKVLGSFPAGSSRAELVGESLLRDPEQGIPIRLVVASTMPSQLTLGSSPAISCRSASNVDEGREDEKLRGHELLGSSLRRLGVQAGAGEPPDDHEARDTLDEGIEAEPDQRDRACEDAERDAEHALGAHPHQADPREDAGTTSRT